MQGMTAGIQGRSGHRPVGLRRLPVRLSFQVGPMTGDAMLGVKVASEGDLLPLRISLRGGDEPYRQRRPGDDSAASRNPEF
jgi:hypothetical protein